MVNLLPDNGLNVAGPIIRYPSWLRSPGAVILSSWYNSNTAASLWRNLGTKITFSISLLPFFTPSHPRPPLLYILYTPLPGKAGGGGGEWRDIYKLNPEVAVSRECGAHHVGHPFHWWASFSTTPNNHPSPPFWREHALHLFHSSPLPHAWVRAGTRREREQERERDRGGWLGFIRGS